MDTVWLAATALTWVREGRTVLSDVDFTARPQEWISVIGPNGGGKTSLIRLLLGLETPTRGHIYRAPGLRMGYVPQSLSVDRSLPLTVARFLALFAPVDHQKDPMGALAVWMECFPLQDLLSRSIHVLSRGQWQMVLLVRALLGAPQLLVLDEPTRGLDIQAEMAYYQQLDQLRTTQQMAICVVSHDLHWVMAKTDRVYCVNQHMCCTGTPGEVTGDPAYQRWFAPYVHHHDHRHV